MTMTDTVSDMLTRVRNALQAKKADVSLPYSKFKFNLAKVMQDEGWIKRVEMREEAGIKNLVIELKYSSTGEPIISGLKRVSKPGQRIYSKRDNLPRVMGSMGTTIVSTSKGLMTDKVARKTRVGGEIICQIW